MDKEKFGIFAINLKCKMVGDKGVQTYDKMRKISTSIGFKQKDKTWVNEWLSLVIFDTDIDTEGLVKGDTLKVSGRISLSEWTNKAGEKKKDWSCFVEELTKDGESNPF